jgi:hypothetical protein
MAIATKLVEGEVVKTVDKPDTEVSSVTGNVLSIHKWGIRKDAEGNETPVDFQGETTIITAEEIANAVATIPSVGGFDMSDILLVFNQVQREDLINSLAAQIRGKKEADPLMKAAKGMAANIEALGPEAGKSLVKIAKKEGMLEQLKEVMGEERVNALL